MFLDTKYLQEQTQAILAQPVSGLTVQPLAGDASTRCYYRLIVDDTPSQSLVLMKLSRENTQEQGQLFCEQQELFIRAGLPVPHIHYYEQERGFIFLEDCGDVMLQDLVEQQGIDACYDYYRQAIDWILKLQAATSTIQGGYLAFDWAFDIPKFTYELDFFVTHMLEGFLGQNIIPEYRKLLSQHFHNLSEILAQEPRYLTHRDYHSRNLMIKDGQLKILDFQDARMGLCQYDLASLLLDSYIEIPEKMVEELLAYYLAQRKHWELPELEEKHFQETFILTCIQRNLKALGTFGYQASQCQNQTYLPYIPRTLDYVRSNLSRCPELLELRKLLQQYLPELNK